MKKIFVYVCVCECMTLTVANECIQWISKNVKQISKLQRECWFEFDVFVERLLSMPCYAFYQTNTHRHNNQLVRFEFEHGCACVGMK